MLDRDAAQMNSIGRRYPESQLLLCWWHVLHAWQQHIVITHYPELWQLLKGWIRISEEQEFQECWQNIMSLAPSSFIEYIKTFWLSVKELWSAVARKNRSIFEEGDTNMLVEA